MPETRRDATFLRDKAARFRGIAAICDRLTAAKLLELSAELEGKAAEMEARSRPKATRPSLER
jgi:hypothetical protein